MGEVGYRHRTGETRHRHGTGENRKIQGRKRQGRGTRQGPWAGETAARDRRDKVGARDRKTKAEARDKDTGQGTICTYTQHIEGWRLNASQAY